MFQILLFLASLNPTVAQEPQSTQTLLERYNALIESGRDSFDACEMSQFEQRREMLAQLDRRQQEIDAFQAQSLQNAQNQTYPFVRVGEFLFRDDRAAPQGRSEWIEGFQSWETELNWFQSIRNDSIDGRWLSLRRAVNNLIQLDAYRVLARENFDLDLGDDVFLARLHDVLLQCERDPACTRPDLSADLLQFIARVSVYDHYRGLLFERAAVEIPGFNDPKLRLERWRREVYFDQERYLFHRYARAHRVAADVLEVELDPGDLSSLRDFIASVVEPLWSHPQLQVRIRWVTQAESPDAIRIVWNAQTAGTASVSWGRKTFALSPEVRIRTLAHEFGHVLGFTDRYFMIWDRARCGYRDRYNTGDLMSYSISGVVQPEDFQELDRHYSWDPTTSLER